MSWNELNDWTDGGVEDYMGAYDAMEFLDENGDEPLWGCDALTGIIEGMNSIREDMPADYEGEYVEYTNMIKELQKVK